MSSLWSLVLVFVVVYIKFTFDGTCSQCLQKLRADAKFLRPNEVDELERDYEYAELIRCIRNEGESAG